jgi:flagellar motor switch protein FliG
LEEVFHHDRKNEGKTQQEGQQQAKGKEPQKKEGAVDEFEDYIKEDEKLEKEGDEYGGLM